MKRWLVILDVFFSILTPTPTMASPLDCERIKDHDERHLCRAYATGSKTWCSFIRNPDIRAKCVAFTR